jgi:hypothetical protein
MAFTLRIETGNAAFADEDGNEDAGPELFDILHGIADRLPTFLPVAAAGVPVLDTNGNTVGRWFYAEKDDELLERVARGIATAHIGFGISEPASRILARAALDAIAR